MKRIILTVLAVFLLYPALAGAQEGAKLLVGTDCDYAPYSSKDAEGNLTGFEIDLSTEIANRLGREVEFVCTPFASAIPSLTTHQFDVLFDTLSITPERLEQVDFSIPYRADTARFGALAAFEGNPFDEAGNPNPKALEGKVVGLQGATVYQDYMTSKFPGVEVRYYDKLDNLYEDLKTGRVDLVIASTSNVWSKLISQDTNAYKFVGPDIEDSTFVSGVGAAVRKGDPLVKQINTALQSIFVDGTFETLNKKYFPFSLLPSVWGSSAK
jgi:ABC-type amino acid transport substrate-binding protein